MPWEPGSAIIDDRALRCVLAVAEAGSLRAAARRLGVAPSIVQRTVAAAERQLGGRLFERGAAGARVTDLGRVVVRHAHERQDLEAVFADEVSRVRTAAVGEARIAVGLGYLEHVGEAVLGSFQDEYPEVNLTVLTGGTDSVVAMLASDRADVAIALHPAPHHDVAVLRSSPQPVGLACAADHPIARAHQCGTVVEAGDLADERFAVMMPGFGLRALHDEFIRVHGLDVRISLETDSQAALIGAVARAQAVSLLPPVFLSPAPSGSEIALLGVQDAHLQAVTERLMIRRGRRLPPAAQALLEACLAWKDT